MMRLLLILAFVLMLALVPAASARDIPEVETYSCFAGGTTIVVGGMVVAQCAGAELYRSGVEACEDSGYQVTVDGRTLNDC